MKKISIKKGQVIQREGEVNSKVYFVKSGLLRSYSIDEKGKEHIFMFAPEEWVVSDSIPPGESSQLFIDAIEDSIVEVREKVIAKDAQVNPTKLFKRMGVLQKRIIMLMSSSAIERYEDFIATYPQIVQRVPQRMIASYLGITPEALSKVKRERITKK